MTKHLQALADAGKGQVTTELEPAREFFYAEEYHQQYLHKVPNGYCGLKGTGVTCALPGPSTDVVHGGESPDATPSEDPKLKPVADSEDEWRARLGPEQYEILRQAGTERPFTGAYNDLEDPGLYRCMACGNPLFRSDDKFHSGSGWPSFTESISPDAVELLTDRKYGMSRTEVRCGRCHSHLGHRFDDGPRDRGGMRYCMNSASLDLDPEA